MSPIRSLYVLLDTDAGVGQTTWPTFPSRSNLDLDSTTRRRSSPRSTARPSASPSRTCTGQSVSRIWRRTSARRRPRRRGRTRTTSRTPTLSRPRARWRSSARRNSRSSRGGGSCCLVLRSERTSWRRLSRLARRARVPVPWSTRTGMRPVRVCWASTRRWDTRRTRGLPGPHQLVSTLLFLPPRLPD